MPEDLELSQIGSSQLSPPFRGLHSPGVRKHCQIIFACYFRKSSVIVMVWLCNNAFILYNYSLPLPLLCVCIGLFQLPRSVGRGSYPWVCVGGRGCSVQRGRSGVREIKPAKINTPFGQLFHRNRTAEAILE